MTILADSVHQMKRHSGLVITAVVFIAAAVGASASLIKRRRSLDTHREPDSDQPVSLRFLRRHIADDVLLGSGAVVEDVILDDAGEDLLSFRVRQHHLYSYPPHRLRRVRGALDGLLPTGYQWAVEISMTDGTACFRRVARNDLAVITP